MSLTIPFTKPWALRYPTENLVPRVATKEHVFCMSIAGMKRSGEN